MCALCGIATRQTEPAAEAVTQERTRFAAVLLLIGAGVANLAAHSIAQTLVQLLAPVGKRGRVVGVYNMASSGLRAGSGLSIGLVGGLVGIHWSLGLSALLLAAIVIGLLLFTARASETTALTAPGLQPTS